MWKDTTLPPKIAGRCFATVTGTVGLFNVENDILKCYQNRNTLKLSNPSPRWRRPPFWNQLNGDNPAIIQRIRTEFNMGTKMRSLKPVLYRALFSNNGSKVRNKFMQTRHIQRRSEGWKGWIAAGGNQEGWQKRDWQGGIWHLTFLGAANLQSAPGADNPRYATDQIIDYCIEQCDRLKLGIK